MKKRKIMNLYLIWLKSIKSLPQSELKKIKKQIEKEIEKYSDIIIRNFLINKLSLIIRLIEFKSMEKSKLSMVLAHQIRKANSILSFKEALQLAWKEVNKYV